MVSVVNVLAALVMFVAKVRLGIKSYAPGLRFAYYIEMFQA